MDESFQTIRSLNTDFVITQRTDDAVVLAVAAANFEGATAPAHLKFQKPRRAWACRWNSNRNEWEDAKELSTPKQGAIREAFIKPVRGGVSLSFSDGREPLVRWGFVADGLTIEHASNTNP